MRNKIAAKKHHIKSAEGQIKTIILNKNFVENNENKLAEILFVTSFPPRECGIATYSQDLIKALNNKFKKSFTIKVCALENGNHKYTDEVKYILETDNSKSYIQLAMDINEDKAIQMVLFQHEFGLFKSNENDFIALLNTISKPIAIVFHTVLPQPNELLKQRVQKITDVAETVIVMTHSSSKILMDDYKVSEEKIAVIPHGTHLVEHTDKEVLKEKYELSGRKILSTFGLLSSGKSIETTINALPNIIKTHPDVLFLIIGKTHPSVIKEEGEQYRNMLMSRINELQLENHVRFVNSYLALDDLLEYLQLTDVYLFTSKDPNQAVSGTFSYAISCGCPIISTPIPHALEVLQDGAGIVIDFENSEQLSEEVIHLLNDEELRENIIANGLHKMAPNAWENSAIAHALLFEKMNNKNISLQFKIPEINLNHLKKMTTNFGMIQFSKINNPDICSGYTLDDNARALVAMCQHFELTKEDADLGYIIRYYNFIKHCLQTEGYFLNYVDEHKKFTKQNNENLADSNGRAIWALGYLISISDLLPEELVTRAQKTLEKALSNVHKIHSPRAMAFIIKGIYYSNKQNNTVDNVSILKHLADRLVQMYKHESNEEWQWFESYLTYANSILSEALLCAWLATGEEKYKEIAKTSFDFLLSKIFKNNSIKVISNKGWLYNGKELIPEKVGGEQPIDVAYTILALDKFNDVFEEETYLEKMNIAFNWFLGKNHLNKIIYNPCTGGCYDGLEEDYINLNQGAESTVSYLMARLAIEKSLVNKNHEKQLQKDFSKLKEQNQYITL